MSRLFDAITLKIWIIMDYWLAILLKSHEKAGCVASLHVVKLKCPYLYDTDYNYPGTQKKYYNYPLNMTYI